MKHEGGSLNSEDCIQWLHTVLDTMRFKSLMSKILIVCDNAPCHVTLEEMMLEELDIGGKNSQTRSIILHAEPNRQCLECG